MIESNNQPLNEKSRVLLELESNDVTQRKEGVNSPSHKKLNIFQKFWNWIKSLFI